MEKLEKLYNVVVALDVFDKSDKTLWDYKMLCESISTALYFSGHKSMYEEMDKFDIDELVIIHSNVYLFKVKYIPHSYIAHIPNNTIFTPAGIQKQFPEYNIKWTAILDKLCDINYIMNIILSYMLAIHISKGGDMIL